MKKDIKILNRLLIVLFAVFIGISFFIDYTPGKSTAKSFSEIIIEMLKVLPPAFILIGLFESWIKKESIEKHLGNNSGFMSYFWVLLLSGFTMGGLYVAFPISESLYEKGASLKVIFAYIGFAGIFRIPMTIFEMSFLGLPFTLVRLLVTIPLVLLVGIVMGNFLKRRNYKLNR